MRNMDVGIPSILNRNFPYVLRTIFNRVGHHRRIVDVRRGIRPKQDFFNVFRGKRPGNRFELFFGKPVWKEPETVHRGDDFFIRARDKGRSVGNFGVQSRRLGKRNPCGKPLDAANRLLERDVGLLRMVFANVFENASHVFGGKRKLPFRRNI